jgi:short-subunit dehydrogenase
MDTSPLQQYGPWALIAGGSEGIGRSFAEQLAANGRNLVLLARNGEALAQAAAAITRDHAVEVRTHTLDLTAADMEEQLANVTDDLEIGLLIYNAGAIHGAAPFLDDPLEKHQQLIRLNCLGPTVLCHQLGRKMRARGRGGIILMSSMSGLTGGAYVATYAASKSFDIVLAESLWAELADSGVHVLGLIAGATDTPAMASSGIVFEPGQAMDPAEVATLGLDNLSNGPVYVAGAMNQLGVPLLRGEDRRQSVALMTAGTAALYGLEMPASLL